MKKLFIVALLFLGIYGCSIVRDRVWNGGYCDACGKEHWAYDKQLHLLYCPRCGYYHLGVDWVDSTMIKDVLLAEEKMKLIKETIKTKIEENKK